MDPSKRTLAKQKLLFSNHEIEKLQKYLNITGQKIVPLDSVKYLQLTRQRDLHWKTHLTSLEKKLSKSIGLLLKIGYNVPKFLLRSIYYSIFNSHLIYGCEIWGQKQKMCSFKDYKSFKKKLNA